MLNFANCTECGKIFIKTTKNICASCIQADDNLFLEVREYLRTYKNAFLRDVVEDTNADLNKIIAWIEQGRLLLHDNPNLLITCERCGQQSRSGRFCNSCRTEMKNQLAKASSEIHEKSKPQKQLQSTRYHTQ